MKAVIIDANRQEVAANKNLIKTAERVSDIDVSTLDEHQIYATDEADMSDSVITDSIKEGNYNAVSSDALSKYIADQFYLDKWQSISGSGVYTFVAEYDGIGVWKQDARTQMRCGTTITHLDGTTQNIDARTSGSGASNGDYIWTLPLVKGETYSYGTSTNANPPVVRYYTKRDYSRRDI